MARGLKIFQAKGDTSGEELNRAQQATAEALRFLENSVANISLTPGVAGAAGPFFGSLNFGERTYGQFCHANPGSGLVAMGCLPIANSETGGITGPVDDNDSNYTGYTVAAAINSICGQRWNNSLCRGFGTLPRFAAKFKWPLAADIVGVRIWIALCEATAPLDAANSVAADEYIGLRYTAGTDTTWKLCSSDGTTASEIDTGIAPTIATPHYAVLDFTDPTSLKAYMDGVLIGTKTTNLPPLTTNLGLNAVIGMTQLATTVTRELRISYALFDRK